MVFDLNEGGTFESDDNYGLEISFDPGLDEVTDENGQVIFGSPEGTRGPLDQDLVVNFKLSASEGFNIGEDFGIDEVIYQIDDCNEGSANFVLNSDGSGSFTIPAGVEMIEIVFNLNDETLNNSDLDDGTPGFEMELTGIEGNPQDVLLNINNVFEYVVLDDEDIFTEWVLDFEDPALLQAFLDLFSPISEDLEELTEADIDEIKFEYGFEEVAITITLVEIETVEECDETEEVNLEIEIEGEFEVEDGELVMVLENEDGDEFEYTGPYEVVQGSPNMLTFTISGKDEDGEEVAAENTLKLERDE